MIVQDTMQYLSQLDPEVGASVHIPMQKSAIVEAEKPDAE